MKDRFCSRCGDCINDRHGSAKTCLPCGITATRDPLRAKAQNLAKKAIRKGLLPHPTELLCFDCGSPASCYDHRNYYLPLKVKLVCNSCNSLRGQAFPPPLNRNWTRINDHILMGGTQLKDMTNGRLQVTMPKGKA